MPQLTFSETATKRLDAWLKQQFKDIPYVHLQKTFRKGLVKVNKKKAKGDERLCAGDTILIPQHFVEDTPSKVNGWLTETEKNKFFSLIIFEHKDFIAIDKPSGLATQGGSGIKNSVDQLAKKIMGPEYRIVHRLDKYTTGVLLIARHLAAAQSLTTMFKEGKIHKTYIASLSKQPKQKTCTVKAPLKKALIGGEEKVIVVDDGQHAVTHFEVLQKQLPVIVKLTPETGRTHQLRAHCAHLGVPIVGDKKYGYKGSKIPLQLHAHKLQFEWSGELIQICCKTPFYDGSIGK